eukprot:scaffold189091_cov30-Tisochrysis_lutea.AAC.3
MKTSGFHSPGSCSMRATTTLRSVTVTSVLEEVVAREEDGCDQRRPDRLRIEEREGALPPHPFSERWRHPSLAFRLHNLPRELQNDGRGRLESHQTLHEREDAAEAHQLQPKPRGGIERGSEREFRCRLGSISKEVEVALVGLRGEIPGAVGEEAGELEDVHAVELLESLAHAQHRERATL